MSEIKSSLVAKQRVLCESETESSFTTWHQSMMFHIVIDSRFSRFADSNDLGLWKSSATLNRGFTDDPRTGDDAPPADVRMTAAQKATTLKVLLGSIATFAPVISNRYITEQSTSLNQIWDRLRGHYGIRVTGSRILDLAGMCLKDNESYSACWERFSSFVESNLLAANSDILHLNEKNTTQESYSPTLQNITVVLWLRAINPELPNIIKQRFSTQLKYNTLFSLRDDICEALPSLIAEIANREYSVNLAKASILADMSDDEGIVNFAKDFKYKASIKSKPKSKKFQMYKPQRSCCLCKAAGRPDFHTHFLSGCKFLPAEDRKYMSSVRDVIAATDSSDSEVESNSACAVSTPTANKVDVLASPVLKVTVHEKPAYLTLDTGAQVNLVLEKECERLGLEILPSLQKAAMADGVTPIPTVGEVLFKCEKSHHSLIFKGLVVKKLSCAVLAGQPFLALNDVFTRASLRMIYVESCCQFE